MTDRREDAFRQLLLKGLNQELTVSVQDSVGAMIIEQEDSMRTLLANEKRGACSALGL